MSAIEPAGLSQRLNWRDWPLSDGLGTWRQRSDDLEDIPQSTLANLAARMRKDPDINVYDYELVCKFAHAGHESNSEMNALYAKAGLLV